MLLTPALNKSEHHQDSGTYLNISFCPGCSQATMTLVPCIIFLLFSWCTCKRYFSAGLRILTLGSWTYCYFPPFNYEKMWLTMIKCFSYCFRDGIWSQLWLTPDLLLIHSTNIVRHVCYARCSLEDSMNEGEEGMLQRPCAHRIYLLAGEAGGRSQTNT